MEPQQEVELISTEEVLIQDFVMEHPGATPGSFSKEEYEAAHSALQFTNGIDRALGITLVDDGLANISRDVLATYKTLLYRARLESDEIAEQMLWYRKFAIICMLGFLSIVVGYWMFFV